MSYEPAEDGGVEPRGLQAATGFQGPVPRRRRIFQGGREESGGHDPQRLARPAVFEAAPAALAGSLSMVRKTMGTIHMACHHRPHSRRGPPPGDFIFHIEEGELLES